MAEYKKLFNVEITNTFYTDGVCRDFEIMPTAQSAEIIKNKKLVFRNDITGFRVLYQTIPETSTPLIPLGEFELTFLMTLRNLNGFQNFTNLNDGPQVYESGNLVYFLNNPVDGTDLDYSLINALRPSIFTYKFPQNDPPPSANGVIEIENENGDDVTPSYPDPNLVTADQNGNYFYPIDFTNLPPGLYTFNTTVGASNEVRKIYIDNNLAVKPIFGLLKIKVVNPFDFPTDEIFKANFFKRETKWLYKMVLKNIVYNPLDVYTIVDELSVYTFAPVLPNEQTNNLTTLVFESNVAIPFTELPRKKFKFVRDPDLAPLPYDVLKDLANPPTNIVSAPLDPTPDFDKSVIYITV